MLKGIEQKRFSFLARKRGHILVVLTAIHSMNFTGELCNWLIKQVVCLNYLVVKDFVVYDELYDLIYV